MNQKVKGRRVLLDAETIVLLVTCLPSRSLGEGWSLAAFLISNSSFFLSYLCR
jgi:hypothetical protein